MAQTFGYTPAQVDALAVRDFELLVRSIEEQLKEAKKKR